MKLIIAGGRDYIFNENDLDNLESISGITEVVSGGAKGADSCGEIWAEFKQLPLKTFPANWKMGKFAGHLRNQQMAEYADAVALFPGGRGTRDMYRRAVKEGLKIYDFR